MLFFGSSADTWEWDGDTWVKVAEAAADGIDAPIPRSSPEMVYDATRSRLVLYGGTESRSDTWESDTLATPSPAHQMRVHLSSADARINPHDCFTPTADCPIDAVEIHALAGGTGGVAQESGAALGIWTGLSYDTLETNTSAAEDAEAGTLSATIDDPALLPQLFVGDEKTLHLQMTVKDPDLYPSTTELSTDYIEVRVRYHHPEETPDGGPADAGMGDAGPAGP